MTLPVAADLKTFLRIETTDEDALVAQLLTRAQAMVETYIGRPLIAVPNLTTVDDAITHELYGRVTTLQTDLWPIDPAAVAVVDADAETVDPTTYRIVASRGQIVGLPGTSFVHGPYTITYSAGHQGRAREPDDLMAGWNGGAHVEMGQGAINNDFARLMFADIFQLVTFGGTANAAKVN